MEAAADISLDAARLEQLEGAVAEIRQAVERQGQLPSGSDSEQPNWDRTALHDQLQRVEDRLTRSASRNLV